MNYGVFQDVRSFPSDVRLKSAVLHQCRFPPGEFGVHQHRRHYERLCMFPLRCPTDQGVVHERFGVSFRQDGRQVRLQGLSLFLAFYNRFAVDRGGQRVLYLACFVNWVGLFGAAWSTEIWQLLITQASFSSLSLRGCETEAE